MKKVTKRTLLSKSKIIIEQSKNIKYYDEQSRLTLEIEELADGKENWRKKYEYSELQEIETLLIGDNSIETKTTSKNSLGDVIEIITINNSNNKTIYFWILNKTRNLITEKEFNNDGELTIQTLKYLNSEGKVIKVIEDEYYQTNYSYTNGNISNVQIIDNGKLVLNEDYYYDKHGNEIRSLGIDKEYGEEIEVKKSYDLNNNLIKEEQIKNGDLEYLKIFEYNTNHELLKIESKNLFNGEIALTEVEIQ